MDRERKSSDSFSQDDFEYIARTHSAVVLDKAEPATGSHFQILSPGAVATFELHHPLAPAFRALHDFHHLGILAFLGGLPNPQWLHDTQKSHDGPVSVGKAVRAMQKACSSLRPEFMK